MNNNCNSKNFGNYKSNDEMWNLALEGKSTVVSNYLAINTYINVNEISLDNTFTSCHINVLLRICHNAYQPAGDFSFEALCETRRNNLLTFSERRKWYEVIVTIKDGFGNEVYHRTYVYVEGENIFNYIAKTPRILNGNFLYQKGIDAYSEYTNKERLPV